jgi:hypothetical protein
LGIRSADFIVESLAGVECRFLYEIVSDFHENFIRPHNFALNEADFVDRRLGLGSNGGYLNFMG